MRRSSEARVLPVDVLHRQEATAARFTKVVEAAHVLVRDLARNPQLVVELTELRLVDGA